MVRRWLALVSDQFSDGFWLIVLRIFKI